MEIIHTTMYAVTEPNSLKIAAKFSHHFDCVVALRYLCLPVDNGCAYQSSAPNYAKPRMQQWPRDSAFLQKQPIRNMYVSNNKTLLNDSQYHIPDSYIHTQTPDPQICIHCRAASATPIYSFLTLLLLAAALTLSSSSDLATFSPSAPSFAAFSPSSCFTVLFDSGAASAPCLRSDSLRQLICPPSASRCICALRFAAVMDVRAYLLAVSRHAIWVEGWRHTRRGEWPCRMPRGAWLSSSG